LYNIKRKKYKTAGTELAFAKVKRNIKQFVQNWHWPKSKEI